MKYNFDQNDTTSTIYGHASTLSNGSSTPKFISEDKKNMHIPRKTGKVGNQDKEKRHTKNNKNKVEWTLPEKEDQ